MIRRRALVIVFLVAFAGCSSSSSTAKKPAPPARHVLRGTVTLTGFVMSQSGQEGQTCWGRDAFSDIRPDAQVRVLDESGSIVATGSLVSSRYGGEWPNYQCSLGLSVPDVPSAKFYTVKIGEREGPTYSIADMKRMGWTVEMGLGAR